jgi:hypothetical protein
MLPSALELLNREIEKTRSAIWIRGNDWRQSASSSAASRRAKAASEGEPLTHGDLGRFAKPHVAP